VQERIIEVCTGVRYRFHMYKRSKRQSHMTIIPANKNVIAQLLMHDIEHSGKVVQIRRR